MDRHLNSRDYPSPPSSISQRLTHPPPLLHISMPLPMHIIPQRSRHKHSLLHRSRFSPDRNQHLQHPLTHQPLPHILHLPPLTLSLALAHSSLVAFTHSLSCPTLPGGSTACSRSQYDRRRPLAHRPRIRACHASYANLTITSSPADYSRADTRVSSWSIPAPQSRYSPFPPQPS
jgi:hypothetical protein